MSKPRKLVRGVGINDADYSVLVTETVGYVNGKRKQRIVWECPIYKRWSNMITRCYYAKTHEVRPTYKDCTVCAEWLRFSNFRKWMIEQDWEGMQLDKDLMFANCKEYSPKSCIFVSTTVNSFLTEREANRGKWPIGVTWKEKNQKFQANCNNPFTLKMEYLGLFDCPREAHKAWLSKKLEHAYALAAIQTDPRVAKALIERYENYVPDVAVKEKGV